MTALRIIYVANILVAGWISVSSLFYPKIAATTVFQNAYPATDTIRLVGALWLSIAVLSILGLWKPYSFAPVLLIQLIYKGSWLLVVALPAILKNAPYPKSMAAFFLIWVLLLPFVIPWQRMFA